MKKNLSPLSIVLLVLLVITAFLAYNNYQEVQKLKKDPQMLARQEVNDVVAKVSKLIVLPKGEEPTLATVQDPEKVKDQPFFVNAKKGDKVLIYTNAKKAILYNPESNRIVEVAPLNIGNPQSPGVDKKTGTGK